MTISKLAPKVTKNRHKLCPLHIHCGNFCSMDECKLPDQMLAPRKAPPSLANCSTAVARGLPHSNGLAARPGATMNAQTDTEPEVDTEVDTAREEPWTILVHNDDVTPYQFVIDTLGRVFSLSAEIAETVTWEAHSKGVAPVCSRPKSEAKRLISDAHTLARSAGYPLTISMEPKS